MRLLSLNIWGGRVFEPLMRFFEQQARSVDVFCLQEVFHTPTDKKEGRGVRTNILAEMSSTLADFEHVFAPTVECSDFEGPVDFAVSYGLAVFVRKSIAVHSHGSVWVYPGRESANRGHPRIVQHVRVRHDGKDLTICNFHGLVLEVPDPKMDSPERLGQSRKIREFLDGEKGRKILCGDFNLRPDTESMRILEKNMINLVQPDHIPTTRSSLYAGSEKFSDYVLVSSDIRVRSFGVLPDVVSDHLPLVLDFS